MIRAGEITDDEVLTAFPDVRLDHDNKLFYKGILCREYLINRCDDCGRWHTPPRWMCPACWSTNITPTQVDGRGTVDLVTFLHQGPPAPGVAYATPYPLAAVLLDGVDGLRVSGTIVGVAKDDIAIGLRVKLAWVEREGIPYPVFEPLSEGAVPDGA